MDLEDFNSLNQNLSVHLFQKTRRCVKNANELIYDTCLVMLGDSIPQTLNFQKIGKFQILTKHTPLLQDSVCGK
jgi:hypothetical protein